MIVIRVVRLGRSILLAGKWRSETVASGTTGRQARLVAVLTVGGGGGAVSLSKSELFSMPLCGLDDVKGLVAEVALGGDRERSLTHPYPRNLGERRVILHHMRRGDSG